MVTNINFRQATLEDATFVATVMMEAVGFPLMENGETPEERTIDICRRTDTLYTYRNAVIAEICGKAVGALISYPGKGYHDIKVHTFSLVKEFVSFNVDTMDDETQDGEYYLDSAAVIPEYRGQGIGRTIINYGISRAKELNLTPVLACDPENKNAYHLYTSLGFKEEGTLFIFGETYLKMKKT